MGGGEARARPTVVAAFLVPPVWAFPPSVPVAAMLEISAFDSATDSHKQSLDYCDFIVHV